MRSPAPFERVNRNKRTSPDRRSCVCQLAPAGHDNRRTRLLLSRLHGVNEPPNGPITAGLGRSRARPNTYFIVCRKQPAAKCCGHQLSGKSSTSAWLGRSRGGVRRPSLRGARCGTPGSIRRSISANGCSRLDGKIHETTDDAVDVVLTTDDLRGIESPASKITIRREISRDDGADEPSLSGGQRNQ
jgi:hypothetical protein